MLSRKAWVLSGVLAVAAALGAIQFAARSTVAPACQAHARLHELRYVDYTSYGYRHDSNTICNFRRADGSDDVVDLKELVPFFTDLWVSFAMDVEITIPLFFVLFAGAGAGLAKATRRDPPRQDRSPP